MSETSLSRHRPSVHLVTPAIVERTVARRGVSAMLSPRERETLETLVLEKRRRDWVAGRLAAKEAVRRACRAAGEAVPSHAAIDIRNEADGAPAFTVREQPWLAERFNLSIAHSDGAAVAAIAETATTGRVGVDLEVTKPLDLALVRRVLNTRELARIDDSRGSHPAPLVMWTAKEAAMKAAHHACDALRDVELSWRSSGAMSARVVRASSPMIRVRHRVVGPYTVAVALCRMQRS